MAFLTTKAGLPSFAAATADLLPSLASAFSSRARPSRLNSPPASYTPASTIASSSSVARFSTTSSSGAARTTRHGAPSSISVACDGPSPVDMRTSMSNQNRAMAFASSPLVNRLTLRQMSPPRHFSATIAPSRSFYTASLFRTSLSPFTHFMALQPQQRRGFRVGGLSRNLLAHMEESANRNPSSATAQNAFYQALLKANMPAIIIERYESGRFATNAAATEAYQKAVNLQSGNAGNATGFSESEISETLKGSGNLSATQVQAATQAIAAKYRGGSLAVAKDNTGNGGKSSPLHVVVDETIGGVIFRWVKFLMWFCLVTYLSLVVATMLIEGLSIMGKKPGGLGGPGGKDQSEVKAENQKTRFTDVHGADEAKEEVMEVVEFLRNPEKFSQLGGKMPKGILLSGPPGTGKTLLARAVAGEAGVPFFYMSGSEFDEIYVGVGAKRVRDLFAAAKAKSPSIIFIDELDAVGGRRTGRDLAHSKQTLNQILTELDGFDQDSNIVIIGATNFAESLDKALIRPGRFDRHITVSLPDVRGRLAILQHHSRRIKAAMDVDLKAIALSTSGMSGAELENIVNQAAIRASKSKVASVRKEDFDWAKDRVIMGAERKSMVITPEEKEMTAYHEAGHALVSLLAQDSLSKLYKVTVLPRGQSLGHTASLPPMDTHSINVSNYRAMIDVALGGKLAEEIVYGTAKVTSGASSDLERASSVAWAMVSQLGMSAKLGNVELASRYKDLSETTKATIESEVRRTVEESYERSRQLLVQHRKELDLLAQALVKYETLSKEEVEKVIRGESLPDRIEVPADAPMTVPVGNAPLTPSNPIPPASDDDGRPPPPPPAAGGMPSNPKSGRS